MTLDRNLLNYQSIPIHPTPALLTQNLPSPCKGEGTIFSGFPPFQGGIKGGNSTCVYTVAPYQGEGIEGWGITFVGQRFELKLTPMHSCDPLLAATINTICRLISTRTLAKYGVAVIADLFVEAIACPLNSR